MSTREKLEGCRAYFPGGPVVKAWAPSARGPGFNPSQETRFHMQQLRPSTAKKKKKKRLLGRNIRNFGLIYNVSFHTKNVWNKCDKMLTLNLVVKLCYVALLGGNVWNILCKKWETYSYHLVANKLMGELTSKQPRGPSDMNVDIDRDCFGWTIS